MLTSLCWCASLTVTQDTSDRCYSYNPACVYVHLHICMACIWHRRDLKLVSPSACSVSLLGGQHLCNRDGCLEGISPLDLLQFTQKNINLNWSWMWLQARFRVHMHGLDSQGTLSHHGLGQRADGSNCFSPAQSNLLLQVVLAPFNTILVPLPFPLGHHIRSTCLCCLGVKVIGFLQCLQNPHRFL